MDQITGETFLDNPLRSVDIKSSQYLVETSKDTAALRCSPCLTSSSKRISANEYTARARVIRACPEL